MNPIFDFTGEVALVTGASAGIGLATATAFAEAGAAVVLVDINERALHAATEALTSSGHRVVGITCDVADEAQAADMVAQAVAAFGRLVWRSTTPPSLVRRVTFSTKRRRPSTKCMRSTCAASGPA